MQIWSKGSGADLIFIHGVAVSHKLFLPMINTLSKKYRVHYLDLPGHGKTQAVDNVDEAVDQIYSALIKKKLNLPIISGHSLGGYFAYKLAERISDTQKLVLLNPLLINTDKSFIKMFYHFSISKNVRAMILHKGAHQFLSSAFVDVLNNIAMQNFELTKTIKMANEAIYTKKEFNSEIIQKTRILHSDNDSVIPYEMFSDELKRVTTLYRGEHDWIFENIQYTVAQIIKHLDS